MNRRDALLLASVFVGFAAIGCRARTPAEKAKDKVEDVTHDAGQAIERAGDRVKDASK